MASAIPYLRGHVARRAALRVCFSSTEPLAEASTKALEGSNPPLILNSQPRTVTLACKVPTTLVTFCPECASSTGVLDDGYKVYCLQGSVPEVPYIRTAQGPFFGP